MSHFSAIVDTKRCEYFGLGKCTSALYEFYDLAMMAMPDFPAPEHAPSGEALVEFRKLLPAAWEVDMAGLCRLYQWLQGQGLSQFVHDDETRDSPLWIVQDQNQYWRCVGSLFSPLEEDIFGWVGYLNIVRQAEGSGGERRERWCGRHGLCATGGRLTSDQREAWIEYLRIHKIDIKGLTA